MPWIKFVILWSCLVGISVAGDGKFEKSPTAMVNLPLWSCPSLELSTIDIIKNYYYPTENHTVRTKDGYMLDVFRIPYSHQCLDRKVKKVVFLMHGLYSSSDAFLLTGSSSGLPYMLADQCYDVWMGNARGNRYSQRHNNLDTSESEFWHFSWHEIGLEDLSASFEYIMFQTKQKDLNYICHGQGCTALMVLLSLRQEFNFNIHNAVFLAPMVYMSHSSLPWRHLQKVFDAVPDGEAKPTLMPNDTKQNDVAKRFCPSMTCDCNYNLIYGKSKHKHDPIITTRFLATHPSSVSVRQLKHFLQVKKSQKFQQYDYGTEKNIIMYNQSTPPEYPLEKIQPQGSLHIFYSDSDWYVSAKDITTLKEMFPKATFHHITDTQWGHGDFLHGRNSRNLVNVPILEILRRNSEEGVDKHLKQSENSEERVGNHTKKSTNSDDGVGQHIKKLNHRRRSKIRRRSKHRRSGKSKY
ncbi:lipase 3 [Drosophila ananassae]|nr:lipase 3 [Drosophila ananassae]